jgi:hypothetical protein
MKYIGLSILLENNDCKANKFFMDLSFDTVDDFKKAKGMISTGTTSCKSEYCEYYNKQKNTYTKNDKGDIPDIADICNGTEETSTSTSAETPTQSGSTIQDILSSVYDDEKKFCKDLKYVRFDIKTGDGVKYNTCLFPSKYARNEKINPLAFYTFRTGLPSGYSKGCYDVVNLREKKESTYGRTYPVTNTYVRFIKGSDCVRSSKVDTTNPVPIDLSGEGFKVPRRDTGSAGVRRMSGQQSTGSTVKAPSPTTQTPGLSSVLNEPKLTDDENYILDLFKEQK